ncbi:MAG: putative circadian clock protein KaiC [Myxococcaceae bacterium]|nr:putative circadian clock protein KaiC [Myxococcaceae bacterium]
MIRPPLQRASTGIEGLDDILGGGLPRDRVYLVQGSPGVGKTTLALQFLIEGARLGEVALYITLSETEPELRSAAASHGWDLAGISLFELDASTAGGDDADEPYTVFHPAEVELSEVMKTLLAHVDAVKPARVVFDSLSDIRMLAQDALNYRRQVIALKQYFAGRACTVIMLDDLTGESADGQLQSLAHGVISLEQAAPNYGTDRRRVRVGKLRGSGFRGGYHDFVVSPGGLRVFPRLVAAEHRRAFSAEPISSGIAAIDTLLGGGLDRGTSTLILGPTGAGKSALATQYVAAAAARGERGALFTFDENLGTLLYRAQALGLDLATHVDNGTVQLQQVDPAELSPGEFVHRVREAVEQHGARIVVIDSLNGYLQSMPSEEFLVIQLHELLTYLSQRGVVTVLIATQHGLLGSGMSTPVDASYVADAVILLRYFEAGGRVRNALAVMKKRSGRHERTIREFTLGPTGFDVGAPMDHFHGVLTGVPTYTGESDPLIRTGDAERHA